MIFDDDRDSLESADLDGDDAVWLPAGTLARLAGRDPSAGPRVVWRDSAPMDGDTGRDAAEYVAGILAERRRTNGGT